MEALNLILRSRIFCEVAMNERPVSSPFRRVNLFDEYA